MSPSDFSLDLTRVEKANVVSMLQHETSQSQPGAAHLNLKRQHCAFFLLLFPYETDVFVIFFIIMNVGQIILDTTNTSLILFQHIFSYIYYKL